jgi:hypothetical protein
MCETFNFMISSLLTPPIGGNLLTCNDALFIVPKMSLFTILHRQEGITQDVPVVNFS